MSSWRIQTNLQDQSKSVDLTGATIGLTSILAGKGPNEPVNIQKGEVQKVLELFGYPNSTYPGVQDVIDYVKKSQCWVVAPSSGLNELYGGVLLRTTGTEQLISGQSVNTDTLFDFTAIEASETVGTGNGVLTTFGLTLAIDPTEYNNTSISVKVDGTELTSFSVTDAEPEVITATELTSGSYTRATGVLALEFTAAVADGSVVTVDYTYDASATAYGVVLDKYPSPSEDKAILVEAGDVSGTFNMGVYLKDNDGNWYERSGSPIEFALVDGTKNGFGQNISASVVFENDNLFSVIVNDTVTYSTFTDDTSYVTLLGGSRGDTPAGSDIADGYTAVQTDPNAYSGLDIVFDTTAESTVATKFETMRESTDFRRVRFLLPAVNQTATAHIADPSTSKNNIDNRGIYYYCLNWGIHKDIYNDSNFMCSNMGLIAGKHADIVENGFGGYSPSWIDEDGFGGQLGSSILSFTYGATEDQLKQLQKARLNPVVMDYNYGPMIKASRTTLSVESDYSYIEHSGLADYILGTIEREVLPFQIKKPNDDFHRTVVKSKAETVVSSVASLLEDYTIKCDRENNNDDILNQKKFVLTIGVIFTPFSKQIVFNFINTQSGVDIEEVVAKA